MINNKIDEYDTHRFLGKENIWSNRDNFNNDIMVFCTMSQV